MLYRPPNAPIDWLYCFYSVLDKAYNENKEMLASEDINIDLLNHIENTHTTNCSNKTDHKAVKLNDILTDLNLHQIVDKPSRDTGTSKTLIDHIYVSHQSNITEFYVPFYAISNHCPVCVAWKKSYTKNKNSTNEITCRCTKHLNETQLVTDQLSLPLNCPHSNFVDLYEALQAWYR